MAGRVPEPLLPGHSEAKFSTAKLQAVTSLLPDSTGRLPNCCQTALEVSRSAGDLGFMASLEAAVVETPPLARPSVNMGARISGS